MKKRKLKGLLNGNLFEDRIALTRTPSMKPLAETNSGVHHLLLFAQGLGAMPGPAYLNRRKKQWT